MKLLIFIIIILILVFIFKINKKDKKIDTYIKETEVLSIKIETYQNKDFMKFGVLHNYFYRNSSMDKWVHFFDFEEDDMIHFNPNQLIIQNNLTFFYIGWFYIVSLDNGLNWFIWNAEEDLLNYKGRNYNLIEKVKIDSKTGEGIMFLNVIRYDCPCLVTKDFGRTWHNKGNDNGR